MAGFNLFHQAQGDKGPLISRGVKFLRAPRAHLVQLFVVHKIEGHDKLKWRWQVNFQLLALTKTRPLRRLIYQWTVDPYEWFTRKSPNCSLRCIRCVLKLLWLKYILRSKWPTCQGWQILGVKHVLCMSRVVSFALHVVSMNVCVCVCDLSGYMDMVTMRWWTYKWTPHNHLSSYCVCVAIDNDNKDIECTLSTKNEHWPELTTLAKFEFSLSLFYASMFIASRVNIFLWIF